MKRYNIYVDVRELVDQPVGRGQYIRGIMGELCKIAPDFNYNFLSDTRKFELNICNHTVNTSKHSGFLWHQEIIRKIKWNDRAVFIATKSPIIPAIRGGRSIFVFYDLVSKMSKKHVKLKTKIVENCFTYYALKNARKVLSISNASAQDAYALYPACKSKMVIAYPAAKSCFKKLKTRNDELKKYGINANYILTVGTIEPRKNHISLIKAFKELPSEFRNYKLVIAGKYGWGCEEFIKYRTDNKLNERVIITGYVNDSDLVNIYNGAELFVYPSYYEGFGMPVIEAMRCGLPVITSKTSSMPEAAGPAAKYIDPYDYIDIKNNIIELLSEKKLREHMIRESIIQANKFNWNVSATTLMNLITSF
jgi:glycosyltransferase involved in cell wall biosynthesis